MSFITSTGGINSPFTAGGVAYGTGSGASVSAAGTTGQVLTSAGAGTPTWATAASGSFTLVSTLSAVGTTTLSWTGLSGSYTYVLIYNGIGSGGFADNNQVRVGAASILTSGYIFQGQYNNGTAVTQYNSGGSLAGFYISAALNITNPSGYTYITQTPTTFGVNFNAEVSDQNGYQAFITGYNTGLSAIINRIQVFEPSRNWTVGSVSLYKLTT
jgi:hypothetical protein